MSRARAHQCGERYSVRLCEKETHRLDRAERAVALHDGLAVCRRHLFQRLHTSRSVIQQPPIPSPRQSNGTSNPACVGGFGGQQGTRQCQLEPRSNAEAGSRHKAKKEGAGLLAAISGWPKQSGSFDGSVGLKKGETERGKMEKEKAGVKSSGGLGTAPWVRCRASLPCFFRLRLHVLAAPGLAVNAPAGECLPYRHAPFSQAIRRDSLTAANTGIL